ncbi:MAG TPA: DinB family protein [Ktedonobacterales bacterium]
MVFAGWEGHQTSLVNTVAKLTTEQLALQPTPDVSLPHLAGRPTPRLATVGETVRHLCAGRIDWFLRMHPPGGDEIAALVPAWEYDAHGNRYMDDRAIALTVGDLVKWLEISWRLIERTLAEWTVGDLAQTYRHIYHGTTYLVSRQWTIWRILAHDLHHGGGLAILLGMQGVELPELGDQFGHITPVPEAPDDPA